MGPGNPSERRGHQLGQLLIQRRRLFLQERKGPTVRMRSNLKLLSAIAGAVDGDLAGCRVPPCGRGAEAQHPDHPLRRPRICRRGFPRLPRYPDAEPRFAREERRAVFERLCFRTLLQPHPRRPLDGPIPAAVRPRVQPGRDRVRRTSAFRFPKRRSPTGSRRPAM